MKKESQIEYFVSLSLFFLKRPSQVDGQSYQTSKYCTLLVTRDIVMGVGRSVLCGSKPRAPKGRSSDFAFFSTLRAKRTDLVFPTSLVRQTELRVVDEN